MRWCVAAQVAYLNAVQHGCKHVFFSGSFLRHENTVAMRVLSYATQFWSNGALEALFLRHEGCVCVCVCVCDALVCCCG